PRLTWSPSWARSVGATCGAPGGGPPLARDPSVPSSLELCPFLPWRVHHAYSVRHGYLEVLRGHKRSSNRSAKILHGSRSTPNQSTPAVYDGFPEGGGGGMSL